MYSGSIDFSNLTRRESKFVNTATIISLDQDERIASPRTYHPLRYLVGLVQVLLKLSVRYIILNEESFS